MYDHGGMNRAYRLIWNRAKGRWIVAPEKARGGGHPVGAVALAGLVAGLAILPGDAMADPAAAIAATALPTGGRVVAGSVSIGENGSSMTVTQGSARGIVEWKGFDVGSSAAVTFKQPDAASVTLNRVTGGNGSVIAGKVNANGKVYVVNPNGVLFAKGAQVDVGGLVASTADIANQDFMAGKEVFTSKGATGSVVNQGAITARDGGAVVLIGGTVSNQGTINARGGDAVLAAGAKVTLNAGANGHLKIEVDGATTAALVENGGLISASGGQVLMTAQGASAAVSSVVANTGTVEAQTIGGKKGQVALLAGMQGGEARVAGTIDASAPAASNPGGGDGGAVETSAAKVTIAPGAKVTTLADKGRTGNWLIDPYNVTISTAADSGGNDTVVNVTTLTNALAMTDITVSTGLAGSPGSQDGNITVAAPISWSANTKLTLEAAGDIFIDKDITATGTTAGLALIFGTGKDYSLRNGARVTLSGASSSFAVNGADYVMVRSGDVLPYITSGRPYAVTQDLDATASSGWFGGAGLQPINGTGLTFAGLGHTIDGLTINRPGTAVVGLVEMLSGTVRDVTLSNLSVVGNGTVGGIAGRLNPGSTIINAHVTGSVTGTGAQVGGLVGLIDQGTIRGSSSAATVRGAGETGGLVGRLRAGSIISSYATGAVTSSAAYAGGLIGGSYQGGTLTDVYASGKVTGTTNTGGLSGGEFFAGAVTATNAYWDIGSTGQSTSDVGTGIATANARTQSTYTGFDFTNDWVMLAGETRPMLRSQYSTVITTPAALQLMALDLTASYKLGADIDFGTAFTADSGSYAGLWGAAGFRPVGVDGSVDRFSGGFDGQNHTITGLTIYRPATRGVGLFGFAQGPIGNVTLSGGTITGESVVGGLIGAFENGTVSNASSSATIVGAGTGGYYGGLIGALWDGTVTSSSARSSVTAPGGDIGGLVGAIEGPGGTVTRSFATGSVTATDPAAGRTEVGGLVGGILAGTTVSESYATGTVSSAAYYVGGLVGFSGGAITDSYASGRVVGTGTASNVGGFVGNNASTGTIANAYATGAVTGPSGASIGGFAGSNGNSASAIATAYWNTQSSGLATGIGNGGGGVTGRTTAQLQGALPTGFSGTIWGTGSGLYPYFGWSYATTPVSVQGKAYSDAGTTALAGATVAAVTNGAAFGSATSGADGSYYILGAAGSINAAGALAYLDNHATKGAAFADTVTAAGVTGLDIHGSAFHLVAGKSSLSATRSGYNTTRGSFSDTDLSFLSTNLFAPLTTTAGHGIHLSAVSGYSLDAPLVSDGPLTLNSGGSLAVGGTIALSAAGALTVNAPLSWSGAAGLTLTTSNNGDITLGGGVSAPTGSLTLSAGGTGTATASAAIDVGNFSLTGGTWSQIATTLPAFAATDFRLTSGTTFLRATGGDGSLSAHYRIADVYGLQGMGSTNLLSKNFRLQGAIDASGTASWNSGAGFTPIGTDGARFTGMLEGQANSISGLTINRSPTNDVGLFGVIGTGGIVANVRLVSGSVTGSERVGMLAGLNAGVIAGNSATGSVTGTSSHIGGLVGDNEGTISYSYATGSVSGREAAGGLAGTNRGTIQNVYATGSVTGTDIDVGGLVGNNRGTISNSYATGSAGGSALMVGGLVGSQTGTVTASFWNTASSGRGAGAGPVIGMTGLDATGMTTLASFAAAGWSIDDQGGTVSNWRIYDGHTAPLLRGFLTGLTVTGGSATKTYDGSAGTTDAGTLTYSVSPTPGQVLGTAAYTANSANAGTYTGTDLTLGGLYSTHSGYDITLAPGTLTIGKAALTVTAGSAAKTYDGLAYSGGTSVGYNGFVNGETEAVLGGTLAYGGTAQGAVNAGSYSVTASGLTSGNYSITYAPGTLTVDKAALTVTASDAAKTYDGRTYDGGAGVRFSGFVNGETTAVLGGTLSYGGTGQGAVNAGSYSLTASGLTSGNYDIGYAPGTLTIGKAALTVTANDAAKTYDGRTYDGGAGVRFSGFVNGETATVLGGTLSYGGTAGGAVNAGTYSVTASGLSAGNYDIGYAPGTLTIGKAALTVTANDAAKTYDGLAYDGSAGVRFSGFINGETASVLGGSLSYGGAGQEAVNAGRYGLTASGLTSGNYDIGYAPGTLTIDRAALTVTANDAVKTYDGRTYGGGAGVRYGGFVNGETAAVLGGTLAYGGTAQGAVNAGTYSLAASGLTSGNYSITYAPGMLTVDKAALTVTANDAAKTYDGLAYGGGAGVRYSGFANGETATVLDGTLAYGGTAQGAVNAGRYGLTVSGLSSGNYDIGYAPGTLTLDKAALVVTADSHTIAVQGKAGPLTYRVGGAGLVHGDTVGRVFSGALSDRSDSSVPGTYAVTQGTLRVVNDNYTLADFIPGTVTVTAGLDTGTPTSGVLKRATQPNPGGETTDQPSAMDTGSSGTSSKLAVAAPSTIGSPSSSFLTFATELIKLGDR